MIYLIATIVTDVLIFIIYNTKEERLNNCSKTRPPQSKVRCHLESQRFHSICVPGFIHYSVILSLLFLSAAQQLLLLWFFFNNISTVFFFNVSMIC